MATIDDFKHIEMKVGTILTAEFIEGADKLLKLSVDFGPKPRSEQGAPNPDPQDPALNEQAGERTSTENNRDIRKILSGIREYYSPEQLIGKQCPFVTNLLPRTMRSLTSYGIILAVKTEDGKAVLLHPDRDVKSGSVLS